MGNYILALIILYIVFSVAARLFGFNQSFSAVLGISLIFTLPVGWLIKLFFGDRQ